MVTGEISEEVAAIKKEEGEVYRRVLCPWVQRKKIRFLTLWIIASMKEDANVVGDEVDCRSFGSKPV